MIRQYLESQIIDWSERQRLENLRESADQQALSDLKRDVTSVRHLLPSVTSLGRNVKSQGFPVDILDEIKQEIATLKTVIKNQFSGSYTSTIPARTTGWTQPPESTSATATTAPTTAIQSSANVNDTTVDSKALTSSRSKRQLPSWMNSSSSSVPTWQLAQANSTEAKAEPSSSSETKSSDLKPMEHSSVSKAVSDSSSGTI